MTKMTAYQVEGDSTPDGFVLVHSQPQCLARLAFTDIMSVQTISELVHQHSMACRYH